MRVAIFTDTFLPQINGVTNTLEKLIRYFEDNKIDYRVFAPQDGNEEYNHKIVRFFSFKFFLYPECRVSLPNYISISEQLNAFKPDLIHVVTPFNIGLCGLKYARDAQIPLVSSYHTNIPQYLEYFNLKFLSNVSWGFFKWFHSFCAKTYCPSQMTLELLRSQGIENLEIWGRGIQVEKYSPKYRSTMMRKEMNLENKTVFLYVGRISPEKDLDIFMKVAQRLNEKYQEHIHFMMVGDGPLTKTLRETAPGNMTFTGFLEGENLSAMYASSDIFLFPSSTETYGNVILEAMASEIPVIACNAGGILENLIDGYNGIGCQERQVESFYRASERLLLNYEIRKQLAVTGRKYAMDMGWDHVFERLVHSYQRVIADAKYLSNNKRTA
ncbi:glycosyltransferase family 4 protein [Geosporobacter ferrireducens]|uniref:Glycosyl transferase family 1 n=1 Tax=Geosporobacter ferrireducens TaxID=1424294 RepID=A0A1D8GCG0_9FIRM|nr:glycosyltransferase family 1 protein [Geosporobacter ferrireducens]AOT68594.1 glycosyl transferase family 1 [Geosporobacter ferrireducens]